MSEEVTFSDGVGGEIKVQTNPATSEEIKESISLQKTENIVSTQILPSIGTIFSIAGNIYKVTYVNEGKNRFSASPVL
jgi:hypothetical protein